MMHQGSLASMSSLNFNRFIGSLGSALPAPIVAFEPSDVHEHDEQPEGRGSGSEPEVVAALQVEVEWLR